jgi:predicted dehydrogenase
VDSYYIQGWLSDRAEDTGCLQAEWRVDPKRAGASGCGGDIGTHALMQLRYVTGLEVKRVQAHLEVFVKNRKLDDHFTVYADLSNGGKALIRASQICIGHKNGMGIEVCGTKGTLRWEQEDPEKLIIHLPGKPDMTYWRGCVQPNDGFLKDVPAELLGEVTIPPGHGEAFHDAFARLHRCFEADVRAYLDKKPFTCDGAKYANIDDGVMGIRFISKCVESSGKGGAWIDM